ncbi:MAG: hypothetical protein ACR2I0_15955 [Rhodoferax sp.]
MTTAQFFMDNFGRHFVAPTDDAWVDVGHVLRGSYPMAHKSASSRMQSGWAIVRPGSASMQLDLEAPGIEKSDRTRHEAFARELADWDGIEPRIFMLFDKAPLLAQHIFISVDKRRVCVCTPAGARIEDWTKHPPKVKGSGK